VGVKIAESQGVMELPRLNVVLPMAIDNQIKEILSMTNVSAGIEGVVG
jgi:hypothetical protein